MDLTLALAIYFICWWLALFMILPIGVRTQQEEGDIVPGSVPSAPAKPYIWKKRGATTLLAAVFFGLVYLVVATDLIDHDAIPVLPDFKPVEG